MLGCTLSSWKVVLGSLLYYKLQIKFCNNECAFMTRLPYTRPAFHCLAFGVPTAFREQWATIPLPFRGNLFTPSGGRGFWAKSIKTLVFPCPTGYHVVIVRFFFMSSTTSGNPMWIWARWSYPAQESFSHRLEGLLGIINQKSSVFKSNRLRVVIARFCGNRTANHSPIGMDTSPLSPGSLRSYRGLGFDMYSLNSFKTFRNYPKVFNFNWSFLKLDRFMCD